VGQPDGPPVSGESFARSADGIVATHLRSGRLVRFTLRRGAEAGPHETRVALLEQRFATTLSAGVKQRTFACWRQEEENGLLVWRPWVSVFGGWIDGKA